MSPRDDKPVAQPVTTTAETLAATTKIINALTRENDLAQPGTVIVSAGHVTILPEHTQVPIHALLTWADHFDGPARWNATVIENPRAAFITAEGSIDGLPVTVSGSSVRVTYDFVDKVRAGPLEAAAPLTRADVLELAAHEDVLGF